jgi:hypothetical protein
MNKRSFLYSAAFIGLAAAGGAAIPQAQAQKGVTLQPSTQWAVNKVATESGGAGYCAVARRFRPNTIMTFARNASDEASFAIDFQSAKFRQAEAMEVVLDPGAGQQRAFEVYPVSNQAFVIRLGQDGEFFSALDKTGYLRVEFDGNSYNFDLADIDVGQTKLATCLNDGGAERDSDFSPRSASNSSVQSDIEKLKRQLAKLQSDNERLTAAPVEAVEREADFENDTADTGSVVSDQLLKQVSALEQENHDLRIRLNSADEDGAKALRSSKDIKTIASLTKENQDLRTALETAQAEDIQEAVLHDQIAELQSENDRLRGEIKEASASGVSSDDVLKVIRENERLKEDLAHKSTDTTQTQSLKAKISTLEQENQALKTTKAAASGDPAALEESLRQIEALKTENKRLQTVVKSSEVTGDAAFIVKELKGQVGKLAEESAAKDKKLLEYSKLSTEVQLLRTTNEELEKQLIESALRGPVNNKVLTQKIVALETQNDSLLQKIQSEADVATEDDAQIIKDLKAENEELKKIIAENATLIEANKKLQDEVKTLRKENDDLKASAAVSASGEDLAAQLQKAQDDNKTLQAQLKQKEIDLAELPALREEIKRLKEENEQLKTGQQNVAAAPAAVNPEVETLHRENESLRAQIAGMGEKDSEIAELKTKLQEQEARIAAAEAAVKKAEADAKTAKESAAKEAEAAQEKADKKTADELKAAEAREKAKAEKTEEIAADIKADEKPVAKKAIEEIKDEPAEAEIAVPEEKATLKAAPPAVEDEMIRLERKLSEAKANGDQMEIQQAARDYINLKSRLSASQELAAVPGDDTARALLAYAGTGKAPVAEVVEQPIDTPVSDSQSEALLSAGAGAKPTSNALPEEEMSEAQRQEKEMSAHNAEDPFAGIKTEDNSGTSENLEKPVEAKASSSAPVSADWGQTTKAEPKTSSGIYEPGVGIPQLLSKADVVSPEAVSVVSGASGANKVSYQWKADKVFGSAVQSPLSDPSRFDGEVQSYLEQTKKRCGKDFAVVPDEETNAGDKRIATYEIACVGQGVSSSASLIFFSQQGTFTVLAHEAPAEQLEDAMEIRDRLVKAISGS